MSKTEEQLRETFAEQFQATPLILPLHWPRIRKGTRRRHGAIVSVITAVCERTAIRYSDRGVRYVHMEAGHTAQSICLQATSVGLAAVVVGAFLGERVAEIQDLPSNEQPLYDVPVDRTAG